MNDNEEEAGSRNILFTASTRLGNQLYFENGEKKNKQENISQVLDCMDKANSLHLLLTLGQVTYVHCLI